MMAGADTDLFEGGPPTGLQTALGLIRPGHPNISRRMWLAVALGWIPLFILSALQSLMLLDGSFRVFLTDYGIHARALIAVPLLIWAESTCPAAMSAIALHFRDTGLVLREEMDRFDRALRSTLWLRDAVQPEIIVLVLAGALIALLVLTLPSGIYPSWQRMGGNTHMSPAGWWHALVSLPMLIILVLGWAWKMVLWTRFLFLVSRLKLQLIPSHPDGAGGLKFLGISTQAFCVLAFPLGAIIAGAIANRVLHDGADLLSFRYVVLGFAIFCLAIFVGPLLVFSGHLLRAWRRGAQEYGALARLMGMELERKWLNRRLDRSALEVPDFSATTDLYSIAANAYTISVVPVSLMNLLALAAGAALPFVPIVLVTTPQVLQKLAGLFF